MTLAAVLFAAAILINPSGAGEAAKSALITCTNSVIPSLFPFFVCSRMLIELGAAEKLGRVLLPVMKPLFGVGGGGALAFVLGIISGYPIGAKTVADLVKDGSCTRSEGEKLLGFCNNSGPVFILGAIGAGLLGNPAAGRLIYAAHLLAALTTGMLMKKLPCEINDKKRRATQTKNKHFGEILTNSVSGGAEAVFTVCGFVIIFAIAADALEHFGILRLLALTGIDYNVCRVLAGGFLEPAGGCSLAVKTFAKNAVLLYTVISAVAGWSGLSVHLQVLGIIKKQGLSARYYFWGKLSMSILAPVYTISLMKLFPHVAAASVFASVNSAPAADISIFTQLAAAAALFAVFISFFPEKSVE